MRTVAVETLPGFEEIAYRIRAVISEDGTLTSLRNTRGSFGKEPIVRAGTLNRDGYIVDDFYSKAYKNGFRLLRHQLVMIAFGGYNRGDYANGIEIDHIDRDRTNNHISNLRLSNRQENIDNSAKSKFSLRKLMYEDILEVYRLKFVENNTYISIATKYNVKYPSIINICNGKTYKEIYDKEIANFV
ncbi:MAG: HNH endonuclease [Fusobacteriaceae bacterium]